MENKKIENNWPKYKEAENRINHKIVQAAALKNFYLDASNESSNLPERKYFYYKGLDWKWKEKTRQNELKHVGQSYLGNIPDPWYPGLYYEPKTGKNSDVYDSRWSGKMIGEKNRTKHVDRKKRKLEGKKKAARNDPGDYLYDQWKASRGH